MDRNPLSILLLLHFTAKLIVLFYSVVVVVFGN